MTWVAGKERPAAFCVPSQNTITTSREATEMLRPVDPPLGSIGHTRLLSSGISLNAEIRDEGI